jgi:CDP-diacylglycerol--serine O-phosphatidyltransferase
MPSGLTFANLFFGIFAIVAASRQEFWDAGLYVVLGGVADMLDGRIARATNTGTRLGAELDSLVDIVTFGVAPAMIMYFAVLNKTGWDWIWAFVYIASVAWRLAVFNVQQAGRAKRYFHGLPSPAAGLTLATYYWFSQTSLYTETNIVDLPWHFVLRFVMLGLAALMISPIPYPAVPTVGYKNTKQILGSLAVIAVIVGVFLVPKQFFFPACLVYILYGLLKTVLLGLFNLRAADDTSETLTARQIEAVAYEEAAAFEPEIAIASGPRLSVSADTPLPPSPNRRRRRRRPRGNRPPDRERNRDRDRDRDRDRSDKPPELPPPGNTPGE